MVYNALMRLSNINFFAVIMSPNRFSDISSPCKSKHQMSEHQHCCAVYGNLNKSDCTFHILYHLCILMQSFWWSEGVIAVHSSSLTEVHMVFNLITGI